MIPSGTVFFALTVAVLLAATLAGLLAALYQRRMLKLMRGGAAPQPAVAVDASPPRPAHGAAWGVGVDVSANRRATARLMFSLAGLCLLVALTQAWLALQFIYTDSKPSANRVFLLTAIYAWPMVLVWGLARRWSWLRILGGVALYMAATAALVMVRSTAAQTLSQVIIGLASEVAVPMTIALLIGASGRIRAVAPYLLPPIMVLCGASVLALQFMADGAQEPAPWVITLVEIFGVSPAFLLIILGPWLVLAWPIVALGRWLAGAYRAKRFSDLSYLVATYWFLILFASALPAMESVGWVAYVELLAWLWIPLVALGLRRPLRPPSGPPTLLVLRVFQHDAQVERLFDQVIERWRLTGNTVLIAGTDLISRTLDPDDLFVYLNGTLAERFIASEAQVAERIAGFDWRPDPDGRYRINECYCFDSTWRTALHALVARTDVVLMDLRGFRAENRGCRYELGVLAGAAHLRRVVVLHDRATDLAVAQADIDATAAQRFQWQPADRLHGALAGRVLAALFDAESATAEAGELAPGR